MNLNVHHCQLTRSRLKSYLAAQGSDLSTSVFCIGLHPLLPIVHWCDEHRSPTTGMAIDGLIILDNTQWVCPAPLHLHLTQISRSRPIIQSGFRSTSHQIQQCAAHNRIARQKDPDPNEDPPTPKQKRCKCYLLQLLFPVEMEFTYISNSAIYHYHHPPSNRHSSYPNHTN